MITQSVGVPRTIALNLTVPAEAGGRVRWALIEAIRAKVREMVRPGADCQTELLEADDETYMHDRKPWPVAALCGGGAV